jgi:hypothetical protein
LKLNFLRPKFMRVIKDFVGLHLDLFVFKLKDSNPTSYISLIQSGWVPRH